MQDREGGNLKAYASAADPSVKIIA